MMIVRDKVIEDKRKSFRDKAIEDRRKSFGDRE